MVLALQVGQNLERAASADLEAQLKDLRSEAARVEQEIANRRGALVDSWLHQNPRISSAHWPHNDKPLSEAEKHVPGYEALYRAQRAYWRRQKGLCDSTCRKCPDWCTKKGRHRAHECSTHVRSGP